VASLPRPRRRFFDHRWLTDGGDGKRRWNEEFWAAGSSDPKEIEDEYENDWEGHQPVPLTQVVSSYKNLLREQDKGRDPTLGE
jgi:hypothetical protein